MRIFVAGIEMEVMVTGLLAHRQRIEQQRQVLMPDGRWDGSRRKIPFLGAGREALPASVSAAVDHPPIGVANGECGVG